jgi:uncharacterized protein
MLPGAWHPTWPQPIEATQTWDMDGAAATFPDINFVIFHVGLPFIDETCWQLVRYPNQYASIAATVNFIVRSPRQFAEWIGKLVARRDQQVFAIATGIGAQVQGTSIQQ